MWRLSGVYTVWCVLILKINEVFVIARLQLFVVVQSKSRIRCQSNVKYVGYTTTRTFIQAFHNL